MAKRVKNIPALHSNIFQQERQLGREVSAKATRYVKSKIRASSITLRGVGSPHLKNTKKNKHERKPLIDATVVKPEMGTHRLLGFQFVSNRPGFVHHFGVVRQNTQFVRTNSRTGTVFKKRVGALDSQAFFDDLYTRSGAQQLLIDGLSKTRTRAISLQLQNTILKIENQDG